MDTILYWNDVALEANRVSHTNGKGEQTGPPLSARALAIVHLAMYDAYAGATRDTENLPPYLPGLPAAPAGASPKAAVAAAAHSALSALFPSQKAFFDAKHAQAGLTGTVGELDGGHDYGLTVAQAILADRKDDPGVSDDGYAPSMARGAHRVDPDNPGQPIHAPFFGARAKCFSVGKRHVLDAPPLPGAAEYTAALREVRGKGVAPELMGTVPSRMSKRTVDETIIGLYWAYDGAKGLGTPPRLYNQIVRVLAEARKFGEAQNARLFALVNVAMGDAGILSWEQKYVHDLWRPVVGVREHDVSMGPGTGTGTGTGDVSDDGDPGWLPMGAPATNTRGKNFTPPFPAYPSGHATFGAAAFHVARLFCGVSHHGPDNLFDGLTFVSEEMNGVNTDNKGTVRPRHLRSFPEGLWGMIRENSISRVYLGVHWRFDGFASRRDGEMDLSREVGGVSLGVRIAEDIFNGGIDKGMTKSTV